MISRPAIEPAISTRPVKNQLIANVSRVPSVRQLIALRTDLECVSAPRNKITSELPYSLAKEYHAAAGSACGCHEVGKNPIAACSKALKIGELLDLPV
jgi:hypothetical protein